MSIKTQIHQVLDELDAAQLQAVLQFVTQLQGKERPKGASLEALRKFRGILSDADAQDMLRAIEGQPVAESPKR